MATFIFIALCSNSDAFYPGRGYCSNYTPCHLINAIFTAANEPTGS